MVQLNQSDSCPDSKKHHNKKSSLQCDEKSAKETDFSVLLHNNYYYVSVSFLLVFGAFCLCHKKAEIQRYSSCVCLGDSVNLAAACLLSLHHHSLYWNIKAFIKPAGLSQKNKTVLSGGFFRGDFIPLVNKTTTMHLPC